MGLFSDKKVRDRAREEQARLGLLAGTAIEAVEAGQARTQSAEEARGAVFGMLGAPGTYDMPGAGSAGGTSDFSNIYTTEGPLAKKSETAKGMLKYGHKTGKAGQQLMKGKRSGIIDADKYAAEMAKTSGFRQQSKLTAEAEQLLNREGPAWERMEKGTLGQISEGAGVSMRETMRELKNNAAKGGTARRAALNEANQILAIQKTNEMKVQQTWQANINLDQYVRENARTQMESNITFLDNMSGIRQSYNQTMNSLAGLMAGVAIPAATTATKEGYAARNAVKEPKIAEKIIMGVVGAVLSYATGTDQTGYWMGIAEGGTAGSGAAGGGSGDLLGGLFGMVGGVAASSGGNSDGPTLGDRASDAYEGVRSWATGTPQNAAYGGGRSGGYSQGITSEDY